MVSTERSAVLGGSRKTSPATAVACPGVYTIGTPYHTALHEIYTPNSQRLSRTRKPRWWKAFEHYKCAQTYRSPSEVVWVSSEGFDDDFIDTETPYNVDLSDAVGTKWGDAGKLNYGLPAFRDASVPEGDLGFTANVSGSLDLVEHSLITMLPNVKNELSLVNSLIELKDVVTLKHTVQRLADFVRTLIKNPATGKTLQKLLLSTADGWLQAQFNIIPFVSDVKAVLASLRDFKSTADKRIAQAGQAQKRHFTRRFIEFPDVDELNDTPTHYLDCMRTYQSSPQLGYGFMCYLLRSRRRVKYQPTVFHAEIQYITEYSEFQTENARLLELLDKLGVNLDPRIIWNAIPWSFTVDWVLKVQDYLSKFKIGNVQPQIQILQYLWSLKRSRLIYVDDEFGYSTGPHSQWPSGEPPITATRTLRALTEESAYCRQLDIPEELWGIPALDGFSLRESSLAASLAITRKRKPRMRSSRGRRIANSIRDLRRKLNNKHAK